MTSRWAITRSAGRAASVRAIPSRVEPRLVPRQAQQVQARDLRDAVVVTEADWLSNDRVQIAALEVSMILPLWWRTQPAWAGPVEWPYG